MLNVPPVTVNIIIAHNLLLTAKRRARVFESAIQIPAKHTKTVCIYSTVLLTTYMFLKQYTSCL